MIAALCAPSFEVQGHRGARAVLPENTIPAFDYALKVGVDVLELDLAVTADDHLVVIHDPVISPERCLDVGGKPLSAGIPVRSVTLARVKQLDCGTLPHTRFPKQQAQPGTRIPTLDEVFAHVKASKHPAAKAVRFNIETKGVPGLPELTPTAEKFAELLVQAIDRAGVRERVIVQSFDQRTLLAMADRAPEITRALLTAENLIDHVAAAKAAKAQIISPHHLWITADDVKRMHAAGLKVVPWTANTPSAWARLKRLGVDGIISDDPEALMKWRTREGSD